MRTFVLIRIVAACAVLCLGACGSDDPTEPVGPVDRVVMTPGVATLVSLGETMQLFATPVDSNNQAITGKDPTWSSSDETVVTVSTTGLATAIVNGDVTITAVIDGVTGMSSLTVEQRADSIEVTPDTVRIQSGAMQQFAAAAWDALGNPISSVTFSWVSVKIGVATVDEATGLAEGVLAAGEDTTDIIASSSDATGTGVLVVFVPPVLTSMPVLRVRSAGSRAGR